MEIRGGEGSKRKRDPKVTSSDDEDEPSVQIHKKRFKKLPSELKTEIKEHDASKLKKTSVIQKDLSIEDAKQDAKEEEKNFDSYTLVKRSDLNLIPAFEIPAEFLPKQHVTKFDCGNQDLNLFLWDLDSVTQKKGPLDDKSDPSERVPVLRAICKTEEGDSVLLWIHGYKAYFYAQVALDQQEPDLTNALKDKKCHEKLCQELLKAMDNELGQKFASRKNMKKPFVIAVELEEKASLMNYQFGEKRLFFKITVSLPNVLNPARNLLAGISDHGSAASIHHAIHIWGKKRLFEVFDCNFAFPLKFLIDTDSQGCGWITLPKRTYTQREGKFCRHLFPIELDTHVKTMQMHDASEGGKWGLVPEIRILSFDIECAGRKGHFPVADEDPVILISLILHVTKSISMQGIEKKDSDSDSKKEKKESKEKQEQKKEPNKQGDKQGNKQGDKQGDKQGGYGGTAGPPMRQCIFSLRSCDAIPGTTKVEFADDEKRMLSCFFFFLRGCGHDVLTGYNISNFDIPYVLNRAKHLGILHYAYWTRLIEPTVAERKTFNSRGTGSQARMDIKMPGALCYDMFRVMVADHKLSSYTLNNVCSLFLSQVKDDIHHSQITPLFHKDATARKLLAKYCIQDAVLVILLMLKLTKLINHIGMARVTGVLIDMLMKRGQGVKTASLLARNCKSQDNIKPFSYRFGMDQDDEAKFEGATVQEAKRRLYFDTPIATLDFASLYPSLMQAHNLCYSTLVRQQDVSRLKPEDMTKVVIGDQTLYYVKAHIRKGIMCVVLERLLAARSKAKHDMKDAEDRGDKGATSIYDGVQLALKICANSVFGFTAGFDFPCPEIGATVTFFGRQSIQAVVDHVKKMFVAGAEVSWTKTNKKKETITLKATCQFNVEVVYGDTDSVMLNFGKITVKEAMLLAEIAADSSTAMFYKPMSLTFEKVYFPYLLINKKRYAGLYFEPGNPDTPKKLDTKGLENVRRDNAAFLRASINIALDFIMKKRNIQGAFDFVKQQVSDLLAGKIDISQLIITKSIAKSDYKSEPLQVALARRIKKRAPGTEPRVGDRVAFILQGGHKKDKMDAKVEEAGYAVEHQIQPDYDLYREKQMTKSLSRLLFFPYLYLREQQGKPLQEYKTSFATSSKAQNANDYYTYLSNLKREDLDKLMIKTMGFLFEGKNTATIHKSSVIHTGLSAILKPKPTCLGCKAAITTASSSSLRDRTHLLCKFCLKKEDQDPQIFLREMEKFNKLEQEASRIWIKCSSCCKDRYNSTEKMCSNNECILFYRRELVMRELNAQKQMIELF